MRILPFCKHWEKLEQDTFTTFRYPRKDSYLGRDWHSGEQVQIVIHTRSPNRVVLGSAVILTKEIREVQMITDEEARADGFEDTDEMMDFLKPRQSYTVVNKFRLQWLERKGVNDGKDVRRDSPDNVVSGHHNAD